jgi:hypothetical protein
MLSHHPNPGGTEAPRYLVTTVHPDGVTCHHTGVTLGEVQAFAAEHNDDLDIATFWTIAPGRIDGVHWVLVA